MSAVGPRVGREVALLSVVVFGAVCELRDEDPYARDEPTVYFNPPPAPERAEVPDPDIAQIHRRHFRGQFASVHTTVDQAPRWQRRLERYRERRRRRGQAGVSFTEFADLSDGRRVIMRNDRGFSWSCLMTVSPRPSRRRWLVSRGSTESSTTPVRRQRLDPWYGTTRESLADEVRDYLLAEEEDCCPISPESVVEHIQRRYDLEVDAASVEAALRLPRRVEFDTRLLQELSRRSVP